MPDGNHPHFATSTLFNDVFRQGVEEVLLAAGFLLSRPLRTIAGAVFTLHLMFYVPEVLGVLFQCVPGIRQRLTTERDGGSVADPEVDFRCLLTSSIGYVDFDFTDEV